MTYEEANNSKLLRGIAWACLALLLWALIAVMAYGQQSQTPWTPKMDSLARATEAEFNLPHGTCKAFALQESRFDPSAVRVETGYFNMGSKYFKQIARDSKQFLDSTGFNVPLSVERSQRSESFGMFQVMGENFRLLGYMNEFLWPTLEEQFHYFGLFIKPLMKHGLRGAAAAYNTGNWKKTGRSYDNNIVRYQRQFSYR